MKIRLKRNFYISWLGFSIGIFLLLLLRDIFVSIYVYIYYDKFYIKFSFLEALKATLGMCIPAFIFHFCLYKYGGQKKLNKYVEKSIKNKKITFWQTVCL
ncbi:hypothetical protein RYD26_12450 [Pasteurellaceae bacterium LIM206]|nr:hypothetical protein [Pasteurellaceae bacterium LIM206]